MTKSPDEYAAELATRLDIFQAMMPRSLQVEIGVSSIGHCHSEALYRLTGVMPTDAPTARQALHGTAIHRLYAEAATAFNPDLIVEQELHVTLPSGLRIKCHPDEIDPSEPSVTDLKTVDEEGDLELLRRNGSTQQQRFQRHLYYLAAHQAGLVPAEGTVRNVWVDRAGQQDKPYVEQEPFSMEVVHDADRWITDVVYAAEHGEEVPRDKHYDWCARYCEFFTHCRRGTTHPDYTITDGELVQALEMLFVAREEKHTAESIEKASRRTLAPLQAHADGDVAAFIAGGYRGRWQWVNTTNKDGSTGGYWKISVDELTPAELAGTR